MLKRPPNVGVCEGRFFLPRQGSAVRIGALVALPFIQQMCNVSCTVFTYKYAMATETTYSNARANLKALLDEAADTREPVIIRRRGGDDVALIAADELRSLIETAHLLRSPANAERLLRALTRAQKGKGRPQSVAKLRRAVGLDE